MLSARDVEDDLAQVQEQPPPLQEPTIIGYTWQWGFVPQAPAQSTPLNAKARSWKPPRALPTPRFEHQIADVVAKLNLALMVESSNVDVHQDSTGRLVTVWIPAHKSERVESVLGLAKEALTSAAEQSTCVYLVGYLDRPFKPVEQGFEVTLAEMQEEDEACWDFFGKGSCARGCSCRWQHSPSTEQVTVLVRYSE
jgi:hypothetical protein